MPCSRILPTLLLVLWPTPLLAGVGRPPVFPALDLGLTGLSAGEILLGELNCVACHQANPATVARLRSKPAPWLGDVGTRLQPGYLREWLLDPLAVEPGTTMPDLLCRLPDRERPVAADELTHFLLSLGTNRPVPSPAAGALQLRQGRVLYHQAGCVACHAPYEAPAAVFRFSRGPSDPDAVRFVLNQLGQSSPPLPDLAAKYTRQGLARFLQDPLAVRPGGRMPSLNLTEAEARAIAAYLQQTTGATPAPRPAATEAFVPNAEKARRGRERFAVLGCAQCHQLAPGLPPIASTLAAPPWDSLNPEAGKGCLSPAPSGQAPRYHLSDTQRESLRAALRNRSTLEEPLPAPQRVLHAMAQLNCHACHSRDGEGGPSPGRSDYFTSLSELDLGDEGRLPPHLSAVGNKLRADWLGQVLTNAGVVRPYMAVRMPQFGAANTAALVADFIASDLVGAASTNRPPAGDPQAGAELVGLEGYSCATCHSFGPHPSLGISVMDLTQMSKRLHWDWFERYLRDPASLRPGTRMPAFWPEDQASVTHLLDGDTARQIASIWAYLSLGADAPPPPGLLESLGRLHDPGGPLPRP